MTQKPSAVSYRAAVERCVESIREGRTAVFAGAGISLQAGIPIVSQLTPRILEALRAEPAQAAAIAGSGLPFELLLQRVGAACGDMTRLVDIFRLGTPTTNHTLFAGLARQRLVTLFCTPNMDTLFEQAFEAEGLRRGADYDVAYKPDQFSAIDWENDSRVRLVKIHGSVEEPDSMAVTLQHVASRYLSRERNEIVRRFFSTGTHSHTLVLGYSCSDLFDITPQIQSIRTHFKDVSLVEHWPSPASAAHVPRTVEDLARREEKNPFRRYPGSLRVFVDSDEFVRELWRGASARDYEAPRVLSTGWERLVAEWAAEVLDRNEGRRQLALSSLLSHFGLHREGLAAARAALTFFRSEKQEDRELETLLVIASAAYDLGDLDLAERHARAAEVLAKRRDDGDALRDLLELRADVALGRGEVQRAKRLWREGVESGDDPYQRARSYTALGAVHRRLAEYPDAIACFRTAMKIYRTVGDPSGEARAIGDLGNLYRQIGDHSRALRHFRNALRRARELGDRSHEGVRLANLGITEAASGGNLRRAETLLRESIEIAKESGDRQAEGSRSGNLGMVYFQEERLVEARREFERALSVARELEDADREARWLTNIGITEAKLGNARRAYEFLEPAYRYLARELGESHPRTRWLEGNLTAVRMRVIEEITSAEG